MGDFKKIFDFEKFAGNRRWQLVKKNPERLFIGAGDPFSSKMWGGITGKKYEPLVDQWGGASKDSYGAAEQQGIDTGPGKRMHDIARIVASIYAGGYGASQLGATGAGSAGVSGSSGASGAPVMPAAVAQSPGSVAATQGGTTTATTAGGSTGPAWLRWARMGQSAARGMQRPQQPPQTPPAASPMADPYGLVASGLPPDMWEDQRLKIMEALLQQQGYPNAA